MTAPVLETENLVKIYGRGETRFDALKGVNLAIREGESVAVVGKSGSGKSTLMHLLALLDAPTHGVVALSGKPTGDLNAKQLNSLRNDTFGFVFQQFFLTPNQSVLDNVTLPLKIAGVPAAERKRRGIEALEKLEMADKADNKATDLSGGQKQRVVIARALINDPSVIFADEPTGNLDSATSRVVEDILFDLNARAGITLVVVTHDPELAARCSRQIHLVDGEIVDYPVGHGPGTGPIPVQSAPDGQLAHGAAAPAATTPGTDGGAAEAASGVGGSSSAAQSGGLTVTEPSTGSVITLSPEDAAEIAEAVRRPRRRGRHAATGTTASDPQGVSE